MLARLEAHKAGQAPILVGADFGTDAFGGPLSVAVLPRQSPSVVRDFHAEYVAAGAELLFALTSDTNRLTLDALGIGYRAAAITSAAVDLAHEAAVAHGGGVMVAGVLAMRVDVGSDALRAELEEQAARLEAAGAEVLVARAQEPLGGDADHALRWAAQIAGRSAIPGLILCPGNAVGRDPDAWLSFLAEIANENSLEGVLLEVADGGAGLACVEAFSKVGQGVRLGLILGGVDRTPEAWADEAHRLASSGVFALGGGAGTTPAHIRELGLRLRKAPSN